MKLIITGSVNVDPNVPVVAILDPQVRIDAYLSTIKWAINSEMFTEIVFCENTNCECSEFESMVAFAERKNKIFEYITFKGNNDKIISRGKGYGEGEIIQYCLDNAKKIFFNSSDYFCKITGRLTIKNIDVLLPYKKHGYSAYFMRKDGLDQIDTRFYCINVEMYRKFFIGIYNTVNDRDNFFLEHAFYLATTRNKINYHMFKHRPLFYGIAGSTGRVYADKKSHYEWLYDCICFSNLYNNKIVWKIIRKFRKVKLTCLK